MRCFGSLPAPLHRDTTCIETTRNEWTPKVPLIADRAVLRGAADSSLTTSGTDSVPGSWDLAI